MVTDIGDINVGDKIYTMMTYVENTFKRWGKNKQICHQDGAVTNIGVSWTWTIESWTFFKRWILTENDLISKKCQLKPTTFRTWKRGESFKSIIYISFNPQDKFKLCNYFMFLKRIQSIKSLTVSNFQILYFQWLRCLGLLLNGYVLV